LDLNVFLLQLLLFPTPCSFELVSISITIFSCTDTNTLW